MVCITPSYLSTSMWFHHLKFARVPGSSFSALGPRSREMVINALNILGLGSTSAKCCPVLQSVYKQKIWTHRSTALQKYKGLQCGSPRYYWINTSSVSITPVLMFQPTISCIVLYLECRAGGELVSIIYKLHQDERCSNAQSLLISSVLEHL